MWTRMPGSHKSIVRGFFFVPPLKSGDAWLLHRGTSFARADKERRQAPFSNLPLLCQLQISSRLLFFISSSPPFCSLLSTCLLSTKSLPCFHLTAGQNSIRVQLLLIRRKTQSLYRPELSSQGKLPPRRRERLPSASRYRVNESRLSEESQKQ